VTGGSARAELRAEIAHLHGDESALIVDVSPSFILQAGLPYAESEVAVVMDLDLHDVPERYQDPERAERLVSVMADALPRGALLVAPAKAWGLQDYARDMGCGLAVFSGENNVTARDRKRARSAAWVADGHVVVEHRGRVMAREPVREGVAPAVQAAAALAARALASSPG
jgi:cyanophycin synthetase